VQRHFLRACPAKRRSKRWSPQTTWKTIIGKAATSTMDEIGAVAASEEK
jgi:hypothetical protein